MIDHLKKVVQDKLIDYPKRYQHVIGVYETAIRLAKYYHVDETKVGIAAIFHDYAKHDDIEDQIKHLELKIIKTYAETPVMYHAFAAANTLEYMFQIKDQEILNAIRYHVWGRTHMTMIDKIIFIADYCEPNRDFLDTTAIYELAIKDIDLAVEYCMKLTMQHVLKKNKVPHEEQVLAYQYYQEVNRGKTE